MLGDMAYHALRATSRRDGTRETCFVKLAIALKSLGERHKNLRVDVGDRKVRVRTYRSTSHRGQFRDIGDICHRNTIRELPRSESGLP